jgi:hypothetical protein
MVFSVAVLTCLVAAAGWCLITRNTASAWLTLALSALWLPANNGQLEGHNLIVLAPTHAMTQGDAVGVVCWLLATTVLVLRARASAPAGQRWARVGAMFLACAVILGIGALAAVETG